MNYFSHYPYQNFSDYNLDYLMDLVKEVNKRLGEYLENSVITFADPITWNITEQYTALTCVVDSDGTAYLSKQPVPVGVDITNTNYWMPIFNYDDSINLLRDNIALNTRTAGTLQTSVNAGDIVWYRGNLYKVRDNLPAGAVIIPDTNADKITVEDWIYLLLNTERTAREQADTLLQNNINAEAEAREQADTQLQGNIDAEAEAREQADTQLQGNIDAEAEAREQADAQLQGDIDAEAEAREQADADIMQIVTSTPTVVDTPEAHGARGNGSIDDTAYVQAALNNAKIVVCAGIYRITAALTVPDNVTITGGGTFIIDGNFTAFNLGNACTINNITFRDTNSEYVAANYVITAQSKSKLTVIDCDFNDIHIGHCINFITCQNITIKRNVINKYSYAGITLSNGCIKAEITYNYVYDGKYTLTNNRYAIILSGYGEVSDGGPADRIYCAFNTCIDTSPWWEAIDSHGCVNTEICYNIIAGFPSPIALVDPTSAPAVNNIQNIYIHHNTMTTAALNNSASGIIISSAYAVKRGITISDNYINIPVNTAAHTHGVAAIGIRGAGTLYENVEIKNNYIHTQSIGIGFQGRFRNVIVENNILNGMLTDADFALLAYEMRGHENVKIINNTVGNEAPVIRGFNLPPMNEISVSLVEVSNNQIYSVQNKYYNAGWSTAPYYTNAIVPADAGMIGQFRPYEGTGNYAGWICTQTGTWKQIAAT